jgi:hypothetical protein
MSAASEHLARQLSTVGRDIDLLGTLILIQQSSEPSRPDVTSYGAGEEPSFRNTAGPVGINADHLRSSSSYRHYFKAGEPNDPRITLDLPAALRSLHMSIISGGSQRC